MNYDDDLEEIRKVLWRLYVFHNPEATKTAREKEQEEYSDPQGKRKGRFFEKERGVHEKFIGAIEQASLMYIMRRWRKSKFLSKPKKGSKV